MPKTYSTRNFVVQSTANRFEAKLFARAKCRINLDNIESLYNLLHNTFVLWMEKQQRLNIIVEIPRMNSDEELIYDTLRKIERESVENCQAKALKTRIYLNYV